VIPGACVVPCIATHSQRDALNYERLVKRIEDATDYDVGDLTELLRKDQRADLATLIKRLVEGYRFLSNLTELESKLANDETGKAQAEADRLTQELRPTPQGR
jgi:hypothetical protein